MEKYEINGVTFYVIQNQCINIDIPDNVNVVVFDRDWSYNLYGVFKSFPQVTKMVIKEDVHLISISNYMFPNVREVESHSAWFDSGRYLCKFGRLRNAFCLHEDEELDISEFDTIEAYALEGCRSSSVKINHEATFEYNAFFGLVKTMIPLKDNRALLIGNMVCNINVPDDKIVIPDDIYDVRDMMVAEPCCTNMKIEIHRKESAYFLKKKWISDAYVFADVDFGDICLYLNNLNSIEFDSHNPYIKSENNIIYSKDGTLLYTILKSKSNDMLVPDGVINIRDYAADNSKIASVVIPDSVSSIGEAAFANCGYLQSAELGSCVQKIEDHCFQNCYSLKSVSTYATVIGVKAFYGCSELESICFENTIKLIETSAFYGCYKLKSIYIPKGCKLQEKSLAGIHNIYLQDKSQLDSRFLSAFMGTFINKFVNVYVEDKYICIPTDISQKHLTMMLENPQILYDDDFIVSVIMNNPTVAKRSLAFDVFNVWPNEKLEKYLRRQAKNLIFDAILKEDKDKVIKILSYNWLSAKQIDDILSTDIEDTTITAYLLDKKNELKPGKSGFSL